jgi:Tol biopolymer transport system component
MEIRRERRVGLPLLGALGLVLGLLIAAFVAAPRVKSVSPENGSDQVPAAASISITFTQRMDPDSVLEHLSVTPATEFTISWEENTLIFEHDDPWPSGSSITITLSSGARSFGFLPLLLTKSWNFTIGQPRVAYLYPAGQPAEIHVQSMGDDQGLPITDTPLGVFDFSLNNASTLIAYSSERSDGSTDLHVLDLVTEEDTLAYSSPQGTRCEAVVASPHGEFLAFECFEFQSSPGGQPIPGPRHVWILSLEEGATPYLAGQMGDITSAPRWSPSGLLSFYDSSLIAIVVVDPSLGPDQDNPLFFPSAMGNLSSWSPDGRNLIFADMVLPLPLSTSEEQLLEIELDFYTHLFLADLTVEGLYDLSGNEQEPVEDASPTYSPDGWTIAFTRRYMDRERFTLGRQIWLKNPDGSNARVLTTETMINHSALAWSPDSNVLAFMRFDLSNISLPAEIWVIDVDGGDAHMLVRGGYMPAWIP